MADKTSVLITGGTSGLGLECAKALALTGKYHVIITGRDHARGDPIAQSIGATFLELELASQQKIRAFVESLEQHLQGHPLHTLICNAGLQFTDSKHRTEDGLETTFAVNHLGHFLLVQLLLVNLLQRPARIVIVASGTHDPDQNTGIEPPRFTTAEKVARGELEGPTPLAGMKAGHCAYSTSKLCNVLFAFELHRKLREKDIQDIQVNAFDPGLTPGTNLARDGGAVISFLFRNAPVWLLQQMLDNVHPAIDSGCSLAALAVSLSYANVSGKYFEHKDRKPFVAKSSADSCSQEKATDLWEFSIKQCGLENQTIF